MVQDQTYATGSASLQEMMGTRNPALYDRESMMGTRNPALYDSKSMIGTRNPAIYNGNQEHSTV
jgi:hypothetical protein